MMAQEMARQFASEADPRIKPTPRSDSGKQGVQPTTPAKPFPPRPVYSKPDQYAQQSTNQPKRVID
jgi:hypothetical protein